MPQSCRVCKLPPKERNQLEKSFIDGVNIYQLTKMYGISDTSIKSHVENHLPEKLVKAAEKTFLLDTTHLVDQIDQIYSWMKIIFKRNYDKGYDKTALKALSEQRNTLQLLAQISVALHKTKVAELEYEGQKQLIESNLPLERLTKKEKDVYFQIMQKLLGDNNVTIDLGYTHVIEDDETQFPMVRKKVVGGEEKSEEKSKVDGDLQIDGENTLKNPPPRLIRKRKPKQYNQPEYERHGMTFQPITEWNGKVDSKVKLKRRRFSRTIQNMDEDELQRANTPGSPLL